MNRALCAVVCQIALGSLNLSAATAAERIRGTTGNELARFVKVLKRCQQVENPILIPKSALYGLDPVGWVKAEFGQNWPERPKVVTNIELAPLHGTILEDYQTSSLNENLPFYVYRPKNGFRGRDQVKILVSIDGRNFLVDFAIQVVKITVDGKCAK